MKTVRLLIVALIALGLFGYSQARAGTAASDRFEPYSLYSGEYSGRTSGAYVAYRARVAVPGALELRLFFGKVSPFSGGAIAEVIAQWRTATHPQGESQVH